MIRARRTAAPRGAAAAFVLLVVWFLTPPAAAQAECLGFEERAVVEGGTNGVESIRVDDVDGDGALDLISASFGDGSVFWYENRGGSPASFAAHTVSRQLPNASAVHSADLDGDGDLDIIGASRDANAIYWFEQAAGLSPIFTLRTVSTETRLPLSVHPADINGDERIDVLSASFLDDTIAWHENLGGVPPTFAEHVVAADAVGAASVFAFDVDGDLDLDVLSASRLDDRVVWYEQTRDGDTGVPVFTARTISDAVVGATSVAAGDLDGDGDVDVVAAGQGDDRLVWFESDGQRPPAFTAHTISAEVRGPRQVRLGDVDQDGHLDVLSASYRDDKVAWFRNDGARPPSFAEHVVSTDAVHADDVALGDLDGDGEVDLVSASSVPGFPASQDKIAWYRNDGTAPPAFEERPVHRSADGAVSAVLVDLDGDSHLDVATAGRTNRISWYRSDGAAIPGFAERIVSLDAVGAADVDAADLNADGAPDLVSVSSGDAKVAWYANDGEPEPAFVEHVVSLAAVDARDVLVTDLDGDGDPDLLVAAASGDGSGFNVAWYEHPGASPPVFTEHVISAATPGARTVHAADVDGDGLTDVLSASYDDDTIVWFENDGAVPPGFVEAAEPIGAVARGATSVFGADLDGDGDTDVLSAEARGKIIAWYESDGAEEPAFVRNILANDADEASFVMATDLDGDQDLDVVAAAPGDRVIAWFENDGQMPPTFVTRLVGGATDHAASAAVGDLDGDGQPDVVAGNLLSVRWYRASDETCQLFDADGDGKIDGVELAWIGRAFGESSADPAAQWWSGVDFDGNGAIDGEDLAILATPGVFGYATVDCSYVCR